MGVVSECCCKEVYYRYPHNNYYFPLSTCISSFFGIIPISLFIFICFFVLIYIYVCHASGPAKDLLNAQRANVGPASNDSKVNNIALKTATLVLRFS